MLMDELIEWCNFNSGFLSLVLFFVTILFGWTSGIFRTLRNKPKLKIGLIDGPTMISTYENGNNYNGLKTHITSVSLYLEITNVGAAPTDLESIAIAYHNLTFKHTFFWFWIKDRTVARSDFMSDLGDGKVKGYPFLEQASIIAQRNPDTYLCVGKKINGIVYFEQRESFGDFKPRITDGKVYVKVKITDTFGQNYYLRSWIPFVPIDEARKYYNDFGCTYEKLKKVN